MAIIIAKTKPLSPNRCGIADHLAKGTRINTRILSLIHTMLALGYCEDVAKLRILCAQDKKEDKTSSRHVRKIEASLTHPASRLPSQNSCIAMSDRISTLNITPTPACSSPPTPRPLPAISLTLITGATNWRIDFLRSRW